MAVRFLAEHGSRKRVESSARAIKKCPRIEPTPFSVILSQASKGMNSTKKLLINTLIIIYKEKVNKKKFANNILKFLACFITG
jgi:hypothetical protein